MMWPLHTSRAVAEKSDDFERLPELVEKYLQGYRMGARPHAGSHGPRRAKRTNDYERGRLMENVLPDEGIIAIPKDKLPPEFVEWIRTMQETANEKLQNADRTLRKIHGLIKAMQTAVQLTYDHQQLGKVEFEATTEWYLENSSRTTAFIVTYGRLFTESKGTYKIERSKVPDELGDIHDEVMRMRNKLYAHNGDHESINTYPEIGFDGTEFEIRLGMTIDVHVGGNNHWDALVTFVNEHINDQLYKNIERLKEETGTVWRTSEGG